MDTNDFSDGESNPVLIALEGIDACGKGTQAALLSFVLGGSVMKFPTYETPSGQTIRRVLSNPHPDQEIAAYSLQALQTINRLEMCDKLWSSLFNAPLVLDRYTASAYAYGMADGLPLDWLRKIEPGSIPQPTIQILIDIPVDNSFTRRPNRDDRYESSRSRLHHVREAYLSLFKNPPQTTSCSGESTKWVIVDGTKSIQEVHEEILKIIPQSSFLE